MGVEEYKIVDEKDEKMKEIEMFLQNFMKRLEKSMDIRYFSFDKIIFMVEKKIIDKEIYSQIVEGSIEQSFIDIRYLSINKLVFIVQEKIIDKEIYLRIVNECKYCKYFEEKIEDEKDIERDLNDLNIYEILRSVKINKLDLEKVIDGLKKTVDDPVFGLRHLHSYDLSH